MNPGQEFDSVIAREVMDNVVLPYSTRIEAAFQVAAKLGVTLIPIEGGQWFAFAGPGPGPGWKSPGEFLAYLGQADFARSGAAVHESAPYAICLAAWSAIQQRKAEKLDSAASSH